MSRPKTYPWDKWFALRKVKLVKGKHFTCEVSTMRQMIRNTASKYRVSVVTESKDETEITFRVLGKLSPL